MFDLVPRFDPIEPYATGMLDIGDGQRVCWEACGNPDGQPVLYLHGGPGGASSPGARRWFDPAVFRAVLFDQRGCGQSLPSAADPDTDLSVNTTAHLISDIEKLRDLHQVEKWTILGLSWGTTLGLAYAQAHPKRVSGLVLALVTTTSGREVEWITEGVGRIFPREWERFASAVPDSLRGLPIVDAYSALLSDPDPSIRQRAAHEWCVWEDAHMSLGPGHQPWLQFEAPKSQFRFARLVTHYWRHHGFLGEEQLIRNIAVLDGIPGVLIHGLYDVSSPLETAWRLHRGWATSELHVIDDMGHGGGEKFVDTVTTALHRLAENGDKWTEKR